jgi:cyclic pyranopterin phosphate synthase
MEASPPQAVRVLCFGALRERLGPERLVREPVSTVADLWMAVTRDDPDLRRSQDRVRAARNLAYCGWEAPVEPGDEVAFMPPVAGGSVDDAAPAVIRTRLVEEPIDVTRLAAELRTDADGAIATFAGVVRGDADGLPVQRLDYEAYPAMAERELRRIAETVAQQHALGGVVIVHRVGSLEVGEVSLAVVAAAPHRAAALGACAEAVEMLKRDLPVWKREHHPGGAEWVDARELARAPGAEPAPGALQPGHLDAAHPGGGQPPEPPGPGAPERAPLDAAHPDAGQPPEPPKPQLAHLDASGSLRMVDVSDRPTNLREAAAGALVRFGAASTVAALRSGAPKGDVLGTARLAGIMAAKRTPDLIPLCHPLPITHVDVRLEVDDALPGVRITSSARCVAATGVEMEALTAAAVAALTVIDMLKSADPWMTVEALALESKSGGRSGAVRRPG